MNDKLEFLNDFSLSAREIWKDGIYIGCLHCRDDKWKLARLHSGQDSRVLRMIANKLDELNKVKR